MTLIRPFLIAAALVALAPQAFKAPSYDEEFEKGRQLLQRHEYFEALKVFKRANEIAGGRSADCFLAMAQAMQGMKTYRNALDTVQTAIDLAGTDARLLARAHRLKGEVFATLADDDPSKLKDAEAAFRAALTVDPESRVADLHYGLGVVLIREGRDADGIAELEREIALRPHGTTADEARALIANPRRAREHYAPDFRFVSTAGDTFSLERVRGKVVLLDFWGTWCAPCVSAVPSLRKLQKAHAADSFVLLGISSDEDESAWRAFVAKNGMIWPQYRDADRELQRAFGITAFPTYVLIDREGIERARIVGTGFDRAKTLGEAIERQLAKP